ncbi:MAG: T9SS type A sorting domain-containing protein [Bacteroidota bacterium]
MRKTTILSAFLLTSLLSFAQCPTTVITLTSQADVDAFITTYPGCTELQNALYITGADIDDLSPLSVITRIGIPNAGGLEIVNNPILVDLDGLENIQDVENGTIRVENNATLENITGFMGLQGNLSSFSLIIKDNPALQSLQGLENVTLPGDDDLIIDNNDLLTDLTGLEGMVGADDVLIWNNDALTSLSGLENFENTGTFSLRNNDAMTSISGLSPNLMVAALWVEDHALLNNLDGLELTTIGEFGELIIEDNLALTDCSASSICTRIAADQTDITVANNDSGCNSIVEIEANCTVICPTNTVLLTSQAEVDAFAATYPGCTELNVNLRIEGSDIVDLSGLSQITTVTEELYIYENPLLEDLGGWNVTLSGPNAEIAFENNPLLNSVNGITVAAGTQLNGVYFAGSPLITSLDIFSGVDFGPLTGIIIDRMDGLTNLSGLENITNADIVYLWNNENLADISALQNITGAVGSIDIDSNPNLTSLDAFSQVTDITGFFLFIFANDSLESLSGLEGITNSNTNELITMDITGNPMLTDISGVQNIDPTKFDSVIIQNNPNLAVCNLLNICNLLAAQGLVDIMGNAPGCASNLEVLEACGLDFNTIGGVIQFDFDNDGCDVDDFDAGAITVDISDGTETFSTTTNHNGEYLMFVDLGTFTTSVATASLPEFFEATPASVETTFGDLGNVEIVDFCLTATQIFDDLRVTMIPIIDARPGFDAIYVMTYENLGTTVLSGQVTLQFDDERQTFVEATPVQDDITANVITWNYEDLLPFQSRQIGVTLNTLPPPTNESGDMLIFNANITPVVDDVNPEDNNYSFTQIVVNSQDPNDKAVSQGEFITLNDLGEYLDYVVRFQNVGTASAINVRIEDVLSDKLDWSSFRVLSASHEYRTEIVDGNFISFFFDEINLPSVDIDPEGSNGYVAFQVRTLETLQLLDFITNEANIFFDFNAPILTNTVSTQVVEILGVDEVMANDGVNLYPNPVSDKLQIQVAEGIIFEKATVYSILGEELFFTSEENIDCTPLSSGIYFVQVTTNRGSVTKKVVKR